MTDTSFPYRMRLGLPYNYSVHFTRNAFRPDNELLARTLRAAPGAPHRALAFLDSGLAEAQPGLSDRLAGYCQAHSGTVELAAPPVVLPGGEQAKEGWGVVQRVLSELAAAGLCRHSFVLCAGGGALLDAVGLATALFHRGMRLVRMPSTALAQDDAGVGVKNGINLDGTKNAVGTFAPPFAVINDLALLRTLRRELVLDGIAEALKVALVRDGEFFRMLEQNAEALARADRDVVDQAVQRCAWLHLHHIASGGDPFERGSARPLDFGHWAGHRLEQLSGGALRHGQGVAVGMALDACYACRTGYLAPDELERVLGTLRRCGLPTQHELLADPDPVLVGLRQFQEHLGGPLTVTLPHGIGAKVEVHEMDRDILRACARHLMEHEERL
jgi:3-dehydroquinate synthase